MKSFKQYSNRRKKRITLSLIKLINEIDNELPDRIENPLAKYEVKSVQAPKAFNALICESAISPSGTWT